MTNTQRIRAAVVAKIEALMNQGAVLNPKWITHAVCAEHEAGLPEGDDGDFWRACGYIAARDVTRRALNDLTGIEADRGPTAQMLLPGFTHVRTFYPVVRDGDEMSVSVVEMSDAEIDRKIDELRVMGDGCYAHADELSRFKVRRSTAEAAD